MYYSLEEVKNLLQKAEDLHPFDGHDYDTGELEGIAGTADRTAHVLMKLLKVLIRKNILTVDEAANIAAEYGEI